MPQHLSPLFIVSHESSTSYIEPHVPFFPFLLAIHSTHPHSVLSASAISCPDNRSKHAKTFPSLRAFVFPPTPAQRLAFCIFSSLTMPSTSIYGPRNANAGRPLGGLPTLAEEEGSSHTSRPVSHLREARPRRPRKHRRSISWDPTIDIYDDTFAFKNGSARDSPIEQAPSDATLDVTLPATRRSTLLGQPAQRLSLGPRNSNAVDANTKKRRISAVHTSRPQGSQSPSATVQLHGIPEPSLGIKKEPRRRTIYIPSDDTTIATIHPGAQEPRTESQPRRPRGSDVFLDLATQTIAAPSICAKPHQADPHTEKRSRSHRQSFSVAPRRAPLQQSARMIQPTTISQDTPGTGGGKENHPPGFGTKDKDHEVPDCTIDLGPLKPANPLIQSSVKESPKRRLSFAPGAGQSSTSTCPEQVDAPQHGSVGDPTPKGLSTQGAMRRSSLIPSRSSRQSIVPEPRQLTGTGRRSSIMMDLPAKLSVPRLSQRALSGHEIYPVLSENVEKPEMYEEHWLSHQETAIAECINALVTESWPNPGPQPGGHTTLRRQLMGLYGDASVSLLHKRLQASLRFGVLSISKETLSQVGRYKDDLQQRQRFLDLWLKTYNISALQCAAEVVVGREMPRSSSLPASPSAGASQTSPTRRRPLESFLKAFLVGNEDRARPRAGSRMSLALGSTDGHDDDFGSQAWAWRRTVVRSLMMILLLDKAQLAGHIDGCLFQASSPFKSSSAVIQALGNLLIPALGTVSRTLEHLSYQVSHVQFALEEYEYRINNLAADLRNGVLLTRLVEILLYHPFSLDVQQQNVTVSLPSGDKLTSAFNTDRNQKCWVLSQHLKYPCISRVQKVYNVQIALSALSGVKDVSGLLDNITAEDIVNGHREKTVGLLWSLVSRWGLSSLVDFKAVKEEIKRLRKEWVLRQPLSAPGPDDSLNDEAELPFLEGLEFHTHLLKTWAEQVGRLHNVPITNLSTSFADGRAFKALLVEYTACLPLKRPSSSPPRRNTKSSLSSSLNTNPGTSLNTSLDTNPSTSTTDRPFIKTTLQTLNCSSAFIHLFTSTTTIPTAQTTIPLLAFLASRLLPLSQPHFAARVIQRVWRRRRARFELKRRVRLAVLARECERVVGAQQRIVGAATRIQRWWRGCEAFWTGTRRRMRKEVEGGV